MITGADGFGEVYILYAYARFPNAVVTRGMNDGVYDHSVAYYAEDDAVGKPVRESPTHLMATRTNLVNKRISGQTVDRITCVPKKLATETLILLLVPGFSVKQVGINFWTDDESVAHSSSLRSNRALTSSQGTAVSGFFSWAWIRDSMSAFSLSVSGSSSSSQSSPSSSASFRRISYRSSDVSFGSSSRISVLLMRKF